MTAALPSFVELMASLGLSKDGDTHDSTSSRRDSSGSRSGSESRSSTTSSPTSSPPLLHVPSPPSTYQSQKSPSIVVSEFDSTGARASEPEFKRRASSGNIKTSRYTPYHPSSRRGSTSTLSDNSQEFEVDKASVPLTCSRRASVQNFKQTTSRIATRRGSEHLSDIKSAACAPISTFARRRSPQTSPTSTSFMQRQRGRGGQADLPPLMSLPTLPPLLAQTFATYSFPLIPSDDQSSDDGSRSPSVDPISPMEIEQPTFVKHQQAGLRISSLCRNGTQHSNYVESRQVSPLA